MSQHNWTLGERAVAYVATLLVLGVLDGLWLGWLAKGLYQREMGELMAASPRPLPAALFYLLYPIGVVFFALGPVPDSAASAFGCCAALGLLAYGTYDLTNMSVIRGFSIQLGIIDMVWGSVVTGAAGTAGFWALRWWSTRGG